jgi:DNA-binding IclR family transcriptional regulator
MLMRTDLLKKAGVSQSTAPRLLQTLTKGSLYEHNAALGL